MKRRESWLILLFVLLLVDVAWAGRPITSNPDRFFLEGTDKNIETAKESYLKGWQTGTRHAKKHYDVTGWGIGGFVGGFFTPIIAPAIYAAIGSSGLPEPAHLMQIKLESKTKNFRLGYLEGYTTKAKTKRANTALLLGAVGSVLGIIVWSSAF